MELPQDMNNSAENPDTKSYSTGCQYRGAGARGAEDTGHGKRQKGQVDSMEDGRKKIWICLLVVVLAAVVIGVIYYYSAPQEKGTEGFLIRAGQSAASQLEPGQQDSSRTAEESGTEKPREAAYVC